MLVRITERCSMQCPHCMVEATPEGKHMTRNVFEKTVRFIKNQGIPVMLMSGGEPTDHPEVLDFIRYSNSHGIATALLSNGEFLHRDNVCGVGGSEFRGEILNLVHTVQVTNDPRYYPRHVPQFSHPRVFWETHLRVITPQGRAKSNGMESSGRASECFNLRSAVRAYGSLREARILLMAHGKFCTPSVNIDGSISAGEAPGCSKIGTVESADGDLAAAIGSLRCKRCGLVANLSATELQAIGES